MTTAKNLKAKNFKQYVLDTVFVLYQLAADILKPMEKWSASIMNSSNGSNVSPRKKDTTYEIGIYTCAKHYSHIMLTLTPELVLLHFISNMALSPFFLLQRLHRSLSPILKSMKLWSDGESTSKTSQSIEQKH